MITSLLVERITGTLGLFLSSTFLPFGNALQVSQEGEAILRVGQFTMIWLAIWMPFGIPMALRFQWYPFRSLPVQQKLILLLPLYGIATPILARWAEFQGVLLSDYGWVMHPRLLHSFAVGLGLGVLTLGTLFSLEYALGWMMGTSPPNQMPGSSSTGSTSPLIPSWMPTIGLSLGLLILASGISFVEELLFRGFLWTELQSGLRPEWAALAASLIFASLHLIWDGWESRSQIWGLTLMGLVLCIARWADHNQLGIAWGLHSGWVWAIASFDQWQRFQLAPTAPLWLTGKPGQPLTGVLTGLSLVATGVGLGWWHYI